MSTLYEDFMQCQGKWANSYIMKTIRQKHKNGKRAARRWLTRAQLKAHFNDDSVVDAIIVRKEADSELAEKEIRDHPDLPGRATSILVCNLRPVVVLCNCRL